MTHAFRRRLWTATRFGLVEQTHNRLAFLLLILFVPIWYGTMGLIVPSDPVAFRFRAGNELLHVNGHALSLLTAGFNAMTLIVGFMLFSATRRDLAFDRRLIWCGFPQQVLMLAKLTTMVIMSALVSLYASGVLLLFWRPQHLGVIWVSFFSAALIYGGLGLFLGVLVPGDLEGFFLIIMTSLMDTFLQNPIGNPMANSAALRWFPSYASTQLAVAGGFTDSIPWRYALLALAWLIGLTIFGLLVFIWRTRARAIHAMPQGPRAIADRAGTSGPLAMNG